MKKTSETREDDVDAKLICADRKMFIRLSTVSSVYQHTLHFSTATLRCLCERLSRPPSDMKSVQPLRVFASSCGKVTPSATSRTFASQFRQTASKRSFASSRSRVPFSVKLRNHVAQARHDHPIFFPVLLTATVVSVLALGFSIYDEFTNHAPQFADYPDDVEQELRFALHYTYMRPDKAAALRHFQRAIRLAEASEMDPFGKEFIGLRIRYAEMLESFGHMKSSIEILNLLAEDCEKKIQEIDESSRDTATKELRKRLLKGIIQFKVKISSLYETDYLQDMAMAKETLSEAVTLLVKEMQDPQTKGFSNDNAADMSYGEIASMLSQMGDLYAVSGEEESAVQVYMLTLQPLRAACNGSRSCKEAQVLSNIASTMDLAMKKPNAKINGRPATKASVEEGRKGVLKWANAALASVNAVPSTQRDSICEMAQISARLTKSDLLLDMGEKQQAKTELSGLIPVLKEKGLEQLIPQAEAALARTAS